jgi:WD40 repeat protein
MVLKQQLQLLQTVPQSTGPEKTAYIRPKRTRSPNSETKGHRDEIKVHKVDQYSADSAAPRVYEQYRTSSDQSILCTKYEQRFVGAANIASDFKESCFLGSNSEYVVGASDDGRLYIWDRYNGEVLCCCDADADILNCVQVHPTLPVLVTAGLDEMIRLWGPEDLKGTNSSHKYDCKFRLFEIILIVCKRFFWLNRRRPLGST